MKHAITHTSGAYFLRFSAWLLFPHTFWLYANFCLKAMTQTFKLDSKRIHKALTQSLGTKFVFFPPPVVCYSTPAYNILSHQFHKMHGPRTPVDF